MFRHPAWAVGSCSSGPPPARTVGSKSTGGFYHSDGSPCISQENLYYSSTLHSAWLQADLLYWSLALSNSSAIWGTEVYGRVWGAGAGPAPSGYGVERIDGSPGMFHM